MANQYLNYISDEHLLNCIEKLYQSYRKAKSDNFEKICCAGKSDTIRRMFDANFNAINEEQRIEYELFRQVEESIRNSIETFHRQILGGTEGFEVANLSGFDVKAKDNTLFAIFGTLQNSTRFKNEAILEKLANTSRIFLRANFHYVLIDDCSDLNEKWILGQDEYSISHKRVFISSIRHFYSIVSGHENAYDNLEETLPEAIKVYLNSPAILAESFYR